MSEQIASITLRADVSDLKTANTELDKLSDAAAGAAAGADSLADAAKRVKPATQQGTEGLKEQQNALKGLLENIDPVTKALNRLDEQQATLRGFQAKGFLDNDTFQSYNKILDDTRLKLTDTGEAAARAQAELAATQAAEKQSASLKSLLGSIDPTIRAFNALDEQHALLVSHFESGRINSSQFEHFNGILNETRQRLTTVADVLPEALTKQQLAAQKAGISIGQYNQALRTLPAQFTDIATQLAGGQSPFLILLQQGGQIKDQFGSVGGAISGVGGYLRGLLGLLNPVTIGIGALVLGVGVLATACYKGTQEASEFNRQLILTGNYSAQSASQLSEMAQKIGGSSNKVAAAAATLSQVVGAGTFKTDQLESVTRAAMAMESATGQSVDATIKNFQKLYANPTKASEDLNSTLHYLTSAQYDYIASLERRGDKEGAAEAAAKAYSQAEQSRSQQIISNLGLVERAANSVRSSLKGMWDELLNIGRPEAPDDMLKRMQADLAIRQKALLPERQGSGYGYATSTADDEYDNRRKAQVAAIKALQAQIAPLQQASNLQNDISVAIAKGKEDDDKRTSSLIYQNRVLEQSASWQEKRSKALSELWKNVAAAPDKWSDAQRQQAVEGINKQFHPDKTAKTPAVRVAAGDRTLDTYNAETLALQAQLKVLQQHTGVNDVISQQRKQQWEIQAKFSVLEDAAKSRTLTKDEQSLLATKDKTLAQAEINAGIGDQIASQQKLNSLADQANKFADQQAAKREEIAAAARGESTREAERASSLQRIKEAYAYNPEAQKKVLAEQRATYQAEDELRDNWIAGAKRGWADYADAATNTYDGVRNVASSTFTGLSDMLTSLMTTGNASIKEFGKSMLKMIVEVTNRLLVAYAVQQALGWISGSSGGGTTPSGAYTNAAAGLSFDSGGYTGSGGKYEPAGIVHKDEFVFTKEATNRLGVDNLYRLMNGGSLARYATGGLVGGQGNSTGATGGINVDIYVDNRGNSTSNVSGGNDGDAASRALAERMKSYVTEGIAKAIRDDGMIGGTFSKK
ncbi:phage tail tape measure protein [Buttiauxella gaviniae]|uniref:phage tail tape measure protein n=1 Tax=Buttiauxella gaviniae TaxID=82990 RepID=UPI003C72EB50